MNQPPENRPENKPEDQRPTPLQTPEAEDRQPAPSPESGAEDRQSTPPPVPPEEGPFPDPFAPEGDSTARGTPPGKAETDAPPPVLPQRPRRRFLRWLGAFLLLALLACGAVGWLAYDFLRSPGSDPAVSAPHDVEVAVFPGATFGTLTPELVRLGAVRDGDKFLLLLRWMRFRNLPHALKPGRFRLNTGWTPQRVIEQLVSGPPLLDRVTIPEGLPWWETGKRLEAAQMVRFEDFAKIIRDPAFLRHWGIPFDSAEGFLFPDTYLIMRPLELNEKTAKSVVGRLIDNFWRRTAPLWPGGKRPGPSGYAEVRRIVTLASIVERETAVASERPRVAGVYANRLRLGMLLQADPTTAYGLGEGFDGNLRRRHLDDADNPYNTYKRPGLPPGPICSPGLACLRAAVRPEAHSYLYFVARGEDGSHVFSSNLADHNRAVRAYWSKMRKK